MLPELATVGYTGTAADQKAAAAGHRVLEDAWFEAIRVSAHDAENVLAAAGELLHCTRRTAS